MKLTDNAKHILNQRYLLKNSNGDIIETPAQLFKRVAKAIAEVEYKYGKTKQEVEALNNEIYDAMTNFDFTVNSPCLMNAGTPLSMLSACFVLGIDDSMESIMQTATESAMLYKAGGGVGLNIGKLRPKGAYIKSTGGTSSGPISFMKIFDAIIDTVKSGGKRRGAGLISMPIEHPDVEEFILCKQEEGIFTNFNLSVLITDKFMDAVKNDLDFNLEFNGKIYKTVKARYLWDLLCKTSWKKGEPAVLFIDTINKANPTPEVGRINTTNPCGESDLLDGESCNLASINLSRFLLSNNQIDHERLRKTVRLAVRVLDNIIDANKFPVKKIEEMTKSNRKIGLGIMGWADLLIKMGIRYDSEEALELAEHIMQFIHSEGFKMSQELGKERGNFPNFSKSTFASKNHTIDPPYLRNATITALAPTGTTSIIANCSQSLEPLFGVVQTRNVKDSIGKNLVEVNETVKNILIEKNIWTPEIEKALMETQCFNCVVGIPDELKSIVRTANDIAPEWHVKMQAAFQKYTDQSISKTVNMPNSATVEDVKNVYELAYKSGCKGITIYRDGSRDNQLLTTGKPKSNCVECGTV